jgi:hypothetical protein
MPSRDMAERPKFEFTVDSYQARKFFTKSIQKNMLSKGGLSVEIGAYLH